MVKTRRTEHACAIRGRSGLPVVFLHGLSANRLCFQFLEAALHENLTCRTLTYDLRGRGKSAKPTGDYSPLVHAQDLHELLRAKPLSRFGQAKPVLIAHSLGAYAALHFAAMHPNALRGLVLLDGGGPLNRTEAVRIYALLRMSFIRLGRRFPSEESYLNIVRKSPLVRKYTPELDRMLRYDMVTDSKGTGLDLPVHVIESELSSAGGSLSILKSLKGLSRFGFAEPDYGAIRCPVLIVRASKRNLFPGDSVLSERSMRKLQSLIHARAIEVPANHYSILLENQP
ncbi:MAG TPA: alpha/beta hydrolase, partial [Leptospiraceae bacterium]|nr:alpha/beta hydrolase [Leptospiraceae bacterium]